MFVSLWWCSVFVGLFPVHLTTDVCQNSIDCNLKFFKSTYDPQKMFAVWDYLQEYFQSNRFLIVVYDRVNSSSETEEFVKGLCRRIQVPIVLMKNFYDNSNNVKEIDRMSSTHGTRMGIIYIFESLNNLNEMVASNMSLKNVQAQYLIVINEVDINKLDITADSVRRIFKYHVILNLIFFFPNAVFKENLAIYDILDKSNYKEHNNNEWGIMKWTSAISNSKNKSLNLNLNLFPIKCTLFQRTPTAIPEKDLPSLFVRNVYVQNILQHSKGYGGLDGMILGTLSETLNFQTIILPPTGGNEYGYKLDNGSYVGSLGDVIYRTSDISINGRFIQQYNTDEIDFLYPVFSDKFCIIAPKALEIPQWVAIFLCFDLQVWMIIVGTNVICGLFWFLLKQWAIHKRKKYQFQYKDNEKHFRDSSQFHVVSIEMWIIMLAGPSAKMPYRTVERLFICTCLLSNLIISGTFQGTLTTAFSTRSFYKDINTLEELDRSGLIIGTSSRSLIDIFGNDGTPVLESLKKKFHMFNRPIMPRTAYKRDVCCIERRADVNVIIKTMYELPNGNNLLHVVNECPRVYYLAYIVKKGWPFAKHFNHVLSQFFEAGLINKWYSDTEDAIIDHKRFTSVREIDLNQAFTLIDMQIAFYILIYGLAFCSVVFILELFYYKCYSRRQNQFNTD